MILMAERKHKTVRIPRKMADAVEDFLKTEDAKKMGFDSKADVVTAAVRDLLVKYGFYKVPAKKETA